MLLEIQNCMFLEKPFLCQLRFLLKLVSFLISLSMYTGIQSLMLFAWNLPLGFVLIIISGGTRFLVLFGHFSRMI